MGNISPPWATENVKKSHKLLGHFTGYFALINNTFHIMKKLLPTQRRQ